MVAILGGLGSFSSIGLKVTVWFMRSGRKMKEVAEDM